MTIKDLLKKAENTTLKEVEIYEKATSNTKLSINNLHTDDITCVNVCDVPEDYDFGNNWRIMTGEEYNKEQLANCGETVENFGWKLNDTLLVAIYEE